MNTPTLDHATAGRTVGARARTFLVRRDRFVLPLAITAPASLHAGNRVTVLSLGAPENRMARPDPTANPAVPTRRLRGLTLPQVHEVTASLQPRIRSGRTVVVVAVVAARAIAHLQVRVRWGAVVLVVAEAEVDRFTDRRVADHTVLPDDANPDLLSETKTPPFGRRVDFASPQINCLLLLGFLRYFAVFLLHPDHCDLGEALFKCGRLQLCRHSFNYVFSHHP